jgi:hypothetical protein
MGIYKPVFYCTTEGIRFAGGVGLVRVASCLYRLMGDRSWVLPCAVDSGLKLADCEMGGVAMCFGVDVGLVPCHRCTPSLHACH